jgi:hypothetical protein
MFPAADYTNGVTPLVDALNRAPDQDIADALKTAIECLDDWALEVSMNPTDENIYCLLLAREHADKTYERVTGKKVPRQ